MSPPQPTGLNPHIFVTDADAAVEFYTSAFGAVELVRNTMPDGTVIFIELAVGPDKLLISEENGELGALSPTTLGGSPVLLTLELEDVDMVTRHVTELGGQVEMPVEEQFWGERYGVIRDPFGHRWAICTKREALAPDEVRRRTPTRIPPTPSAAWES